MKYYELDNYEKELLKDFDNKKIKPNPNLKKEMARLKLYTKATLDKTKNINIRISERDLFKVKALALEKGLPYQTLISSIVHQHSR